MHTISAVVHLIILSDLKRDLERELWTASFRFSWRKMEMTAKD